MSEDTSIPVSFLPLVIITVSSLGGGSPYSSTDTTNTNKCT